MAQNIKRSICLTPGMLEELQIFASSKNITVAEAIRYLLERGLSLTMFTEEPRYHPTFYSRGNRKYPGCHDEAVYGSTDKNAGGYNKSIVRGVTV